MTKKRIIFIKLCSGFIQLFTVLVVFLLLLWRQHGFGSGDIYATLFWTVPLATGLLFCGASFLRLFRSRHLLVRTLFILIMSIALSFGWVYCVAFFLGPLMGAFSISVFYLWIAGSFAQLLFLDRLLPIPSEKTKPLKAILSVLAFPLILACTIVLIYACSFLFSYLNAPEKELYLIPANFEGNFRVIYGEKCGINPPFENGRRVMKIPDNGILIVQPEFKAGTVDNEYFLVDKNGRRTKLNELYDYSERLTKSPGVLMGGSGNSMVPMPDGSSSSESPLTIHYTYFTVYNKDTVSLGEQENSFQVKRLDSTVNSLVEKCRKGK